MMQSLIQLTMCVAIVVMQKAASAQNDCGNTSFSGSEGIVTSPNFPLPYQHNISCTYSIEVGRNKSVLLGFLNFELESPNDGFCEYDWLMIRCNETRGDENLNFGRRLCGATLPRTSLRFSKCPVVQLKFFADSTVNRGGFQIAYNVSESANFTDDESDLDCGQTVFTNSTGIITFPVNPTDYPARVNCIYTISVNNASRISMDITALQRTQILDSFLNCDTDNITVVCSSGLKTLRSQTFCYDLYYHILNMDEASEVVFPNCSVMKISVHSSDYTYREPRNYRGVNGIPFTVITYDEECGNTSFTGPTGIVTSPRFPLSYAHYLNCVYSIDVDRTKTVTLDFLSFHLEGMSATVGWDSCSYDWITVNCLVHGYVPDNPYHQTRRYCGERSKPMTLNVSKCDSLTLNFVSDRNVANGGFQIRYTITSTGFSELNTTDLSAEGCGNTAFTGPAGYIASPGFPLSYPNNLSCVYSIDVDPTKMVALLFLSFSIEGVSHSSFIDRCMHDWLKISCLSNSSVSRSSLSSVSYFWSRRYCGDKETPLIFGATNCDSLTLNFVTDFSITSGGFQLRYRISSKDQPDCGDTSFSGPNGVVTSPHYPYPYPHNMSCKYFIDVGRSKSVLLKFKDFYLEFPNATDNCDDWLMISCKDTTKPNPNYYKKYCGHIEWTSPMRFIDCSSLVLEFVSDSTVNSTGFRIEYTVVVDSSSTEDSSVLDCGTSLFTGSSGFISLPRNTKSYLATINCTYTISANQIGYISVENIYRLFPLLQSFQDCKTESLTIGCVREGEREIDPNTTRIFCRRARGSYFSLMRSVVFGDCRTVKLSIRSNNYDNQQTFQIPFAVHEQSAICGNTSFSATSGYISSPSLFLHHQTTVDCLYVIDSGRINSVFLYLYRLDFDNIIPDTNTSCDKNFLKISCDFNGVSVPHPHADRKLCETASYFSMSLSFHACRRVLLNYSSEYISRYMGFSMRYSLGVYDEECGNTTSFDGLTGFITSPRFPLSYRNNMNCLYTITAGQSKAILLSSVSFSLGGMSNTLSDDSCYQDWLSISCLSDQPAIHGVPSSKRYCGNKTMPLELAFPKCEVVMMHFRSGWSVTREGFTIRYTVIDTDSFCGVPVYGPPSGVISFPLNSTDYANIFNCTYVINATEPSSISLTIWSINAQSSNGTNCQRDWLLINCVAGYTTMDHKVSQSACDNLNSSTQLILTSCSTVNVVYHKESVVSGKAFRLEYTVTSNGNGVVNAHMKSGGGSGRAVGITLTVLVLIGAICLAVFYVFRRHREKNRPEMLIQASELEARQQDLEDDTAKSGFGAFCSEEQDTTRYVPLRPTSLSDEEEP